MIGLLGKGLNANTWVPLELIMAAKGISYGFLAHFREIQSKYSLVISLGYDRMIPQDYLHKTKFGIIVFHSSDLPRGRGWAPLFYTIINNNTLT